MLYKMEYVLARNLHHTEVSKDYHGLYNPLKDHSVLFVNSDAYRTLLQFREPQRIEDYPELTDIKQRLLEDKFLLPADFDQHSVIKYFAEKLSPIPRIVLMYMLLTDACNLRCSYCFEKGNENLAIKKRNMSEQTAENAIYFFSRIVDQEAKEGQKAY